jgi:hypothetical protein
VNENIIIDSVSNKAITWSILLAIIALGLTIYNHWTEIKSHVFRLLRMGRKLASSIKRIFRKPGRHSTATRLVGCCILGLLLFSSFTSCAADPLTIQNNDEGKFTSIDGSVHTLTIPGWDLVDFSSDVPLGTKTIWVYIANQSEMGTRETGSTKTYILAASYWIVGLDSNRKCEVFCKSGETPTVYILGYWK